MTQLSCTFCGKGQREVRKLIAGPNVHICNECVVLCNEVLAEQMVPPAPQPPVEARALAARLDESVVGHAAAKRALVAARVEHDVLARSSAVGRVAPRVLLVGPCGSGKTHLGRALCAAAGTASFAGDVASLSESGYVGDDVEDFAYALLREADHDPARGERGVLFLDGLEKLRAQQPVVRTARDINGEGAQRELLRLLGGAAISVSPQGGPRHPSQAGVPIATERTLVIAAYRCERWAIAEGSSEIALRDAIARDGMLGALVARFDRVVPLRARSAAELEQILRAPGGLLQQAREVVDRASRAAIDLTPAAAHRLAREAAASPVGAWALSIYARRMIEQALASPATALRFDDADVAGWIGQGQ